jgi:chromosome segregation ATPase
MNRKRLSPKPIYVAPAGAQIHGCAFTHSWRCGLQIFRWLRQLVDDLKRSSPMFTHTKLLSAIACLFILSITSFAQTVERRQSNSPGETQEGSAANKTEMEAVARQVGMLRQSVQSLDATLSDIADKFLPLFSKAKDAASETQGRISSSFTLLTQAEQRAEMLRRQLLDLIEKETSIRTRLAQLDEEMRPENIERALSAVGTTRTVELRDTRRRALENERRGLESLLNQITQSRSRLQDDVRDADSLVTKLRLRLLPAIEKEIEKISPE